MTLYSVTSYWHGKLKSRGDIDGGFCNDLPNFLPYVCDLADAGPGFIPFPAQSQDNVPGLDQFTQEVRIASNNSGGLGYQAGIFYFNEDLDIESFDFPAPTSTTIPTRSSTSARTARPGHLRLGQLRIRQWPDPAGRRALEP